MLLPIFVEKRLAHVCHLTVILLYGSINTDTDEGSSLHYGVSEILFWQIRRDFLKLQLKKCNSVK